jgi:hypothetical protein
MIAVVAAIIWALSTLANLPNAGDAVNFALRVVAGAVAVAAGAEWLVLSIRESRQAGMPRIGSAGEPAVPRSAGSSTVFENLLSVFGRRRTAAQDLDLVTSGGAVLVVAYLMERKVRRVWLRVGLDPASLESLESVLGAAPHRVFGTQTPTRGMFDRSAYTQIEGASRSGAWSIAVPTTDVDIVRYALTQADDFR